MKKVIIISAAVLIYHCMFFSGWHKQYSFAKEQAVNSDTAISEYLKLRLDYSQSTEYDPYNSGSSGIKKDYLKLMSEEKFSEAIEKAKDGLKKDRYNIQLLVYLANAYEKTGDSEKAAECRKLWKGLLKSILASGDGKSSETAFKVINVDEEYAVLNQLQLEMLQQRLISANGSDFDVLETRKRSTGEKVTLYFNVDTPFKWLMKKQTSE